MMAKAAIAELREEHAALNNKCKKKEEENKRGQKRGEEGIMTS